MQEVLVPTRDFTYPILIGSDVLSHEEAREWLTKTVSGKLCWVLADANVEPLYGDSVVSHLSAAGATVAGLETVAAGETSKSLTTANLLYERALTAGLDRRSLIVTLGGGVIGDLGGFVAATYLRGIDFVQWPTSLLAQVDSSVGGKVAVDLAAGKNLVGAFHQPRLVVADLDALSTLPETEFQCGMAEIVKYAMIMDAEFFAFLDGQAEAIKARDSETMEKVVARCCQLKAQVVAADERESGLREILNYGHTFGHALEVLAGYGAISHGAAVAVGMGMAADLAVACGRVGRDLVRRQDQLLKKFGLPVRAAFALDAEQFLAAMRRDKKSRGRQLRLVLPSRLGQVETIEGLDEGMVAQAVEGRSG